ncbi:MAG: hypothetical protein H0U76_12100, partial [Ktedonobacteraceae bacterium]|nr:hypothetical protein [Ktedonobacteraceae bacterium]
MSEPAFHFSVVAGDEARTVFALDDAIEHYEQAWQILAQQPEKQTTSGKLSASEVQHLYIALERAYALTRTREQGRPLYAAMLKQVLRVTTQDDDTTMTQWYQAMIDLYTASMLAAIAHGERAVALARSIGQPDLIFQSLDALASIKMQLGAWEEHELLVAETHT